MLFAAVCFTLFLTLPPALAMEDVDRSDNQQFVVPFRFLYGSEADVLELHLFVSWDKGNTWYRIARTTPVKNRFYVNTKRDGLAWFAVRAISKNGIYIGEPADLGKSVSLKVLIESQKK